MPSPAHSALLRLIANATDQQTCDDLALVVHAFEQAKTSLASIVSAVDALHPLDSVVRELVRANMSVPLFRALLAATLALEALES